MIKTILFPTDFSETAQNAFAAALQIAHKTGADIITVHAYELPIIQGATMPISMAEFYAGYDLNEFESYKNSLPVFKEIAATMGMDQVSMTHALEMGDTRSTILRMAKENEADLIVMGTQGASGLMEIFGGSDTAAIAENAPCPVLAIPHGLHVSFPVSNIAVTTGLNDEDIQVIKYASLFSNLWDAKLHSVYVDTAHTDNLSHREEAWENAVSKEVANVHFHTLEGELISDTVTQFCEENNIPLIIMLSHKRNWFQELLQRSHAKEMVNRADVAVLVVPAAIIE